MSTDLEQRIYSRLESVKAEIAKLEGKQEVADKLSRESAELVADADVTMKARILLEQYSEESQSQLLDRVRMLVSRGLQVIFGDEYEFEIEVSQKRKQVAADFKIRIGGAERDPLQSHGGGLVNVVAFVLRLVVVALTPGLSRTVVLDEPFAQLSAGYLESVGLFLREVCDATGIQLIIVSHEPEITAVADQAWQLRKDGTQVTLEAV